MAQIANRLTAASCDWWQRCGDGTTVDIGRFCQAGHRVTYWPSNWQQFCHIDRISPLIFLNWCDGLFHVRASAQKPRHDIAFSTPSCRRAVGRAVRAKASRETLNFAHCHGPLRRFTPVASALGGCATMVSRVGP